MPPQHYQQPAQAQPHYHQPHHHHMSNTSTNTISLSSSAPTNTDVHALMRSSLMNSAQVASLTNYEFAQLASQAKSTSGHTSQPSSQGHIYGSQVSVQQQQSQSQTNQSNQQLLLQQRALAAKHLQQLQQQQQQHIRPQTSMAQYNNLATTKSLPVQQYYITQHPSQQGHHPQYLATLSRHQHAQAQQQYLSSLNSQQQQLQQQQFATLTRHHQQQLQQHLQPVFQQQGLNYSQLAMPQRQPISSGMQISGNARLVQIPVSRQTPPPAGNQSGKILGQAYPTQYQTGTTVGLATAGGSTASYARKSLVEWTVEDVQEWLQRIGMAEHRPKFESFNGAKMLRLDNNSLVNIGVRQQQHRIYILEKLKQQIWQNHQ